MSTFDLSRTNYSLFALPLVWTVGFLPHPVKLGVLASEGHQWNNVQPRQNTAEAAATLDKKTLAKVQRLEGAHLNGTETFPLFAAALLAGNVARLPVKALNTFAFGYLASRILFNILYVSQQSATVSWTRSAVWFSAIGANLWVLVKSALLISS